MPQLARHFPVTFCGLVRTRASRFAPLGRLRIWYADVEGRVAPEVCNTTLVLSCMQYLLREKQVPIQLVDKNLRTDYAKIRHLVTVNRAECGIIPL